MIANDLLNLKLVFIGQGDQGQTYNLLILGFLALLIILLTLCCLRISRQIQELRILGEHNRTLFIRLLRQQMTERTMPGGISRWMFLMAEETFGVKPDFLDETPRSNAEIEYILLIDKEDGRWLLSPWPKKELNKRFLKSFKGQGKLGKHSQDYDAYQAAKTAKVVRLSPLSFGETLDFEVEQVVQEAGITFERTDIVYLYYAS